MSGVLAASIGGGIAATLGFFTLSVVTAPTLEPLTTQDYRFLLGIFCFAAVTSLAGTALVLFPVTFVLKSYYAEGAASYATSGLIGGLIMSALLFMPVPFDTNNISYQIIFLGGFSGALGGIAWWYAYRRAVATNVIDQAGP